MKMFRSVAVPLFLLLFAGISAAQDAPAVVGSYTIGTGDVLEISVWKEEALSKRLVVLPDGMIQFPLVGELAAAGRTVIDLKTEIEQKLEPFIPEPVLSVSVIQVNSMLIYVIGKVNKPGRFDLNSSVDTLQALATAGGLNPFAKEKKIRIYRKNGNETQEFGFNYKEVSEGIHLEQNIMLERGDVIVVP